jgi:hypothetical protein
LSQTWIGRNDAILALRAFSENMTAASSHFTTISSLSSSAAVPLEISKLLRRSSTFSTQPKQLNQRTPVHYSDTVLALYSPFVRLERQTSATSARCLFASLHIFSSSICGIRRCQKDHPYELQTAKQFIIHPSHYKYRTVLHCIKIQDTLSRFTIHHPEQHNKRIDNNVVWYSYPVRRVLD